MSADDKNETSFKCRRCRQFLFDGSSVLPSIHIDNDSTTSLAGDDGNIAEAVSPGQCNVSTALWYISDDSTPPWIQSEIDKSQWTRGKLSCPKCGGRLGSFDFLTPSIRHDSDRQQKQWSCIQINGSRVDRETPDSVLSKLKRGSPSTRLHLANPDIDSNSDKLHGSETDKHPKIDSLHKERQVVLEEHPSRQMLNSQDKTHGFRLLDVDRDSDKPLQGPEVDRPTDSHSSPEEWQDFLDELLFEYEAERNRMQSPASRQCSVSQLDDEMENDNGKTAFENTGVRVSQSENPDTSQSMSASLQRAVLRVQKRERNRRKSERRKLRRQERWTERKKTEKRELLAEVENLDAAPRDILNLLDSHNQTSASIREALTCPVCLDLFLNPHTCRPCGHIFCESCLRHLAHATQVSGGTPPCPLCRTVIVNAQPYERLTAAIQELFPRLVAQRKQAEHRILKSAHLLPGQNAPTSLASWINRTLVGHNSRTGLHHWRWRGGRQERMTVGLITTAAWQFGAVVVCMSVLVGISGIFLFALINYS